ncbi:MAG: hydroxyacid dehydrogenase [Akkermansiaceae bacterium]
MQICDHNKRLQMHQSEHEKARTKPALAFLLEADLAGEVYPASVMEELAGLGDIRTGFISGKDWRKHRSELREVEVIFSGWGAPLFDQELLAAVPNLRAVFYGAGSIQRIVTEDFWRKNIPISCAASANGVPVSEYTISQIIFLLKDGYRYARAVRERRAWVKHWPVAGAYGSKVGLVSLGSIGALVAEKLRDLDVEVLAYDPYVSSQRAKELGASMVSLEELFLKSDVISVHAPLRPDTVGLIHEKLLRSMKSGAALINTARGAVIDQDALTRTLSEREDLFAVLDVTWPEPPPAESIIYDLPNVVMTPHIAGSMSRECQRMGLLMIQEFERFLNGQPLRWRVTRDMLAWMA